MKRAKAFFYVCAGLVLLMLSYHLGASSAKAQSVSGIVDVESVGGFYMSNGDFFFQTSPHVWSKTGNVFGSAQTSNTIVAAGGDFALAANGDIYYAATSSLTDPLVSWQLWGHLGGATPAQRTTLGQLKARYR